MRRFEAADDLRGVVELGDVAVDEVAGDDDEVGLEIVGGVADFFQPMRAAKDAGVEIADMGDGEALELGREVGERDVEAANAEVVARGGAVNAHGDGGGGHGAAGGEVDEAAAGEVLRLQRRGRDRPCATRPRMSVTTMVPRKRTWTKRRFQTISTESGK